MCIPENFGLMQLLTIILSKATGKVLPVIDYSVTKKKANE